MEIKGSDLFKAGFCVAAGVTAWKVVDHVFYHFLKKILDDTSKKDKKVHYRKYYSDGPFYETEKKADEKSDV